MEHELCFTLSDMPITMIAESRTASAAFVHQDRLLSHHVLLYINSGELEVIEDGVRFVLRAGSLLFLLAGVHHWGEAACAPHTRWTFIHFQLPQREAESDQPFQLPVRRQELTADDYARTIRLPKVLHHLQTGDITEKLDRMVMLFGSNILLRAAYLTAVLTELLLEIYTTANPTSYSATDPVTMAMRYLEKTIYQYFSAEQLARACERSYNYLCGLFKERTGMSPQVYHRRMQLSECARLLRESQRTISEISQLFGYCNPQYFSRMFSAAYHVSPRQYRKRFILS